MCVLVTRRKAGSPFARAVRSVASCSEMMQRGRVLGIRQALEGVVKVSRNLGMRWGKEVGLLQQNFHLVSAKALEKEKQCLGFIFQAMAYLYPMPSYLGRGLQPSYPDPLPVPLQTCQPAAAETLDYTDSFFFFFYCTEYS